MTRTISEATYVAVRYGPSAVSLAETLTAFLSSCRSALGVSLLDDSTPNHRRFLQHEHRLIIIALNGPGEHVESACMPSLDTHTNLEIMRVLFDPATGRLQIGPWFGPTSTACVRCVNDTPLLNSSHCADASSWLIAMHLIIHSLLQRLTARYVPASLSMIGSYNLHSGHYERLHAAHFSSCPVCNGSPNLADVDCDNTTQLNVPYTFELASRAELSLQPPLSPASLRALTTRAYAKRFPHSERVALPHLDSASCTQYTTQPESTSFSGDLDIVRLSACLQLAAGYCNPDIHTQVSRCTASAGNLGSSELFVLARKVNGLASGLYFYQSHDHSLALFEQQPGPNTNSPATLFDCYGPLSCDAADVIIITTAAYHRLADKYSHFGYRLMLLDAGVTSYQLSAVAASMGLLSRCCYLADDGCVARALNLLEGAEEPIAFVCLWNNSRGLQWWNLLSTAHARRSCQSAPPITTRIDDLVKSLGSHASTHANLRLLSGFSSTPPLHWTTQSSLPSMITAFQTRRSVRSFTSDTITDDDVRTILGFGLEETGYLSDGSPHLRTYLLLHRTTNRKPGFYHVGQDSFYPAFRADLPEPATLSQLFNQPSIASASATLWITADLTDGSAEAYRVALFQAGARAQRYWLGAATAGLQGVITAGFSGALAKERLLLDNAFVTPLLVFAVGRGFHDEDSA